MENGTGIRIAKYGYIILSILICLLGAALMLIPNFSADILRWLGGILLVAFGAVKIVGYLSKDLYRLAFQFDLAFGILLIALGIFFMARISSVSQGICVLLGVFILTDSLLKIQTAIDSRDFGISRWWLILLAAVVSGIIGIVLLFGPKDSTAQMEALLGGAFLADGILNMITVLTSLGKKKTR